MKETTWGKCWRKQRLTLLHSKLILRLEQNGMDPVTELCSYCIRQNQERHKIYILNWRLLKFCCILSIISGIIIQDVSETYFASVFTWFAAITHTFVLLFDLFHVSVRTYYPSILWQIPEKVDIVISTVTRGANSFNYWNLATVSYAGNQSTAR
jgi:hypothetical protein